jgi:hypothetical protein
LRRFGRGVNARKPFEFAQNCPNLISKDKALIKPIRNYRKYETFLNAALTKYPGSCAKKGHLSTRSTYFHMGDIMPAARTPSPVFKMITTVLWGPWLAILLPAMCLAAYWTFGQTGLVAMALGLPAIWIVFGGLATPDEHFDTATKPKVLEQSNELAVHISDLLLTAAPSERMALFCIGIDDADAVIKRLGSKNLEDIQRNLQMRYASRLRNTDFVFLSGKLHWTIAVTPGRNLDLEAAIQQASRLQEVADDAFYIGDGRLSLKQHWVHIGPNAI